MNWDLDRSFAEICTSLPKDARSRIVFTASSFASCLGRIETDRLALTMNNRDTGVDNQTQYANRYAAVLGSPQDPLQSLRGLPPASVSTRFGSRSQ
jgi:hypothetical protein